ncbi:MAG: hypothetical protein WDO71_23190 [Bacteroidota bacterium]
MKKVWNLIVFALLLQSAVYAQPSSSGDLDVSVSGQVILTDNSTVAGTVKENIRKKGELILLTSGKKTKYKAADNQQRTDRRQPVHHLELYFL